MTSFCTRFVMVTSDFCANNVSKSPSFSCNEATTIHIVKSNREKKSPLALFRNTAEPKITRIFRLLLTRRCRRQPFRFLIMRAGTDHRKNLTHMLRIRTANRTQSIVDQFLKKTTKQNKIGTKIMKSNREESEREREKENKEKAHT